MSKSMPIWIAAVFILMATAACAGSVVPTSAPPDAISTIVAATMSAITPEATHTAVPPTVSPLLPTLGPLNTSVPPTLQVVAPTAIVPGATRINFQTGTTTAVISASIPASGTKNYVLQALQGQPMIVNVDSLSHDITLSIKTEGGTSLLSASAQQATWQGSLPQTEDYYLSIHGGTSGENFTLNVIIPARIKFAEGADSAKVTGKTVAGYDVIYTVFAIKGQKMTVDLSNLSGDAALTIYGFTDGQPYVNTMSEQTSFRFTLPATQDYIIEVVPRAGSVGSYLMNIQIQ